MGRYLWQLRNKSFPPLTLEDATQRIEHGFELTHSRLDRIILLLEKLVEE
jgi:hypothetical protein